MKTIYSKFMLAFTGLVIFVFLLIFMGIQFFIEDYYYIQKVETMQKTVRQIETSKNESTNTLDFVEDLEYLGYHFEGKINVYDVESGIAVTDEDVQKYSRGTVIKKLDIGNGQTYILETDYPVKNTRWLVYYEMIPDSTVAILQIPITAIEHTLDVLTTFMVYVAIIVILVAMLIAAVISRNMTKPIKKLTAMAEQIRQLDFNVRYIENRKDEIGTLGETFNNLTDRLDTTIKALKYELSKEKQLDTLRKEFVAQVSHELQTPLSIIHGYIEALEDGVVDSEEERLEYYQIIGEESTKMSGMIKDMLQLSEFEAGTVKGNNEAFDLTDFFSHLNQDYQTLLMNTPIQLKFTPIKKVIMFNGDRMKLEQAFRNILNNAKKYAVAGSEIDFHTSLRDKMLTVTIANEGPHIDEEEIAKIFGSFYKGSNSQGKEGSGIGLAVASKVFEYHDIGFFAKNTEKGVAFYMNIPIDPNIIKIKA